MRSYLIIPLAALATVACSTILAPLLAPGRCSPLSLLLDTESLPHSTWAEAAIINSQDDAVFYEGNERAAMQVLTPTGRLVFTQDLYRFRTPQHAQERYPELERPWFPKAVVKDGLYTPWSPIPDSELALASQSRTRAECRVVIQSGDQECAYVAQVGAYVLQIFANLPPMTLAEFTSTVQQAEDVIASCNSQ